MALQGVGYKQAFAWRRSLFLSHDRMHSFLSAFRFFSVYLFILFCDGLEPKCWGHVTHYVTTPGIILKVRTLMLIWRYQEREMMEFLAIVFWKTAGPFAQWLTERWTSRTADPCLEAPVILVTIICLQSCLCKWSYIYFILKGLDVVSDVFIQTASSSVASRQTELFCGRKWSESRRIRSPAGSVQPISFQTRCDGAVTGPSELRSEVLICLCKCSPWWFISSNPAVPGRRCRFSSLATPPAST